MIPALITQALAGTEIRLGSLRPTRDFNFVADTVEGFLALAAHESAIGEVVNFGSGTEISIGDLASLIGRLLGRELNLVCDEQRLRPDASEVARLCANANKAHDLLGWKSRVTLEQGLQRTIEWMQGNLDEYRIGQYAV